MLGRFVRRLWWPTAVVVLCLVAAVVALRVTGSRGTVVTGGRPPGVGTAAPAAGAPAASVTDGVTLHYASNTGSDISGAAALGYDLFDVGPTRVDAVPAGGKALVWLGNLDNTDCTPGYSWPEFTAAVDRLSHDDRVFGYYISDEPHPRLCPQAAAHIRERADYVHAHSPDQRVFIVVMDAARECGTHPGCEYAALRPAVTHVDLIGIDPFPCGPAGCDPSKIDLEVQRALAAGVPAAAVVPVFQVFGQECADRPTKFYAAPSTVQLRAMLAHWAALVPRPAFDFTYTWRSGGPACPALDRADGVRYADLQAVMRDHNRG